MDQARRPDTDDSHWATKSVGLTIWLRIGMFAPFFSFAFLAAERSEAIAFPHATEPPLPSETDTGIRSPITPASNSTTPTAMINRRVLTICLPSKYQSMEG